MVTTSSQVAFAAQLVAMLVAASGVVLVLWRAELTRGSLARVALVAGFAGLGAVAFASGCDLAGARGLAVARIAFAVVTLAGAALWAGGRRARLALIAGAGVAGIAGVITVAGGSSTVAAVVLGVGALVTVGGLIAAGQRAIGVRVAVNAAATLLVVVVVLSVALSSVLSSSLQHQQLLDLQAGASGQAADVGRLADQNLAGARLVAGELETYFAAPGKTGLAGVVAGAAAGNGADRDRILAPLRTLGTFSQGATFGVAVGRTMITTASSQMRPAVLHGPGRLSCRPGAPGSAGSASVVRSGGDAYAIGAYTLCAGSPIRAVGAVMTVTPVDATYLAGIRSPTAGAGVAVVSPPKTLLASSGPPPTQAQLGHAPSGGVVGDRLLASAPIVVSDTTAVLAWIVSSASTSNLLATAHSLLRTLLIIALGGTVLALVLAAATGSRIAAGLRRITRAAEDVGETGAVGRPLAVVSATAPPDEVGTLATAFGTMVEALEDSGRALQRAADDETRLRNRLEAVVDGMGDALVALDGLGRVTDFNPAAERLTGIPVTAALGVAASELLVLSGDGAGALQAHLERAEPTPWAGIAELARPDGTTVPVAVSSGSVRGPFGEELGSVLVLRDLRAEQEIERMKTEFLSRIGHELRTPLTGILGYAELLAGKDVPADVARPWHDEILAAARQQLRVVRLLELFASLGAGRRTVRPERVEPGPLAEQIAGRWRQRLEVAGASAVRRLDVRVEPGLPPIQADPAWLVVVIDELIDNAVKYSPGGGVLTLAVTTRSQISAADPEAGEVVAGGVPPGPSLRRFDAVEIAVSDQGVGMAPDELARAFGAFEQGDPSDTRRYGGLGLGLAAVVQIVADHDGWVGCRSAVGRGTTVRLLLPIATASDPEPENATEIPLTRRSAPGG
jgi:PAS domain S-box-containing protein